MAPGLEGLSYNSTEGISIKERKKLKEIKVGKKER